MKNNWEKARFEVSALKWIDLSQGDYGVSILTRSKYGYDIHGNKMRITLLRSPTDPDPTADRGSHCIEYALLYLMQKIGKKAIFLEQHMIIIIHC